jgi:M6 family metalloprotease-like protein
LRRFPNAAPRRVARLLLPAAGLACLLALPQPAPARKLAAGKYPAGWAEMRTGGADAAVERISRAPRWSEMRARLPAAARHGHLQIGGPPRALSERRELERRPDVLRGGAVDTVVVKVAVLRVEFETDREGSRTTGDGRFLRENPDPANVFIDPGPHDSDYFAAHLTAVDRYWSSMTYGRVRIEGEVFPRGDPFGSYRLSDMADYGPTSSEEPFSIAGLTRYSRECLIAADADPDVVWSDWDVFFVVHAGADWQNDILQDTPLDLPTFSIAFSDSEVVVADEGDTLSTMITYPESASQDGFQVGLNGGIAHEMGHQLGLLDLYNVETFAPTVAFYDVMDSGNLASVLVASPVNPDSLVEIVGALPTAIGAWNRWLVTYSLGIEPELVKADRPRARLRAIQARPPLPPGTSHWFRLPVSETEYFLVENRVDDLDGRTADGGYNTALDQDDSTGVVLGPIVGDTEEISHNYDLLIDPGVLVWHIDERQALANLSQGRGLNVVFEKRSVTIEEADGLLDIGSPFSPFPLGTDREGFWAGNNSNFTPTSRPSSATNAGTPSGISLMNIGARGHTVVMDIGFTSKPRGWPMTVGGYGTSGRTSATLADVDGDGTTEVAAAGQASAFLFGYEDRDGDGDVDSGAQWPTPSTVPLFGTPSFTPALGDLDGDGRLEVVCVTDSGAVHAFDADGAPYGGAGADGIVANLGADAAPSWSALPADLDGDGADELYVVGFDGHLRCYDLPAAGPAVLRSDRGLLAAATDSVDVPPFGTLAVGDLNADGQPEGVAAFVHADSVHVERFLPTGRPILRVGHPIPEDVDLAATSRVWIGLADLDRDPANGLEIVLVLEAGWVLVLDREGLVLPGWPVALGPFVGGPPAFGDLDGDGLLEIVIGQGTALHALNYNGTEMAGWPARPRLMDFPGEARPTGPAAVADVDGDGRLDAVAGFTDFMLRAIDPEGHVVDGFPIPLGAPGRSSPAILDANGDGRLDLFVQCGDGQVYGRILAGIASAGNPAWPMLGGGPRLHGAYDPARMPAGPRAEASGLLAAGVRVYPNPVRGGSTPLRIRYTLGPDLDPATQVDVSLYNVAGEKVKSLKGTTFANTENVLTLSSGDLASGVYFCTLRARSGAREETARDRFAVIR